MTIQQLRYFLIMAEEQHFTKAADRLHISQPSLSYSISELEKELNLPLFERRNNKTNITRYAEELLPYVQAALGKFDDIQIKAYELSDPSVGTVNLGMIYSISFDFLPKLLERFYADKDNGRINVNLFQGVNMTLTNKLLEGGLDLILSGESEEAGISGAYLFTQDLKLIVPENHPLAGKREVSLKDVKDEGLVSLGETSHISGHITRCFRCRGYEPKFVLNVAECSAMGAFISSNMCVAIAPVVPSLQSCAVKIIPFCKDDRALLSRKIFLRWETSRYLPPAVRKFHDFVLRKFCEVEN